MDRPCRGAGDHGWDGTLLVVVTANSLDFCYAARLSRLRVFGLTALAKMAVTTTIRCRSRDVSTLVTSENSRARLLTEFKTSARPHMDAGFHRRCCCRFGLTCGGCGESAGEACCGY
jgi:hypothetical protein